MPVPQFDLSRAVARIRPQLEERWGRLLDVTSFVGGVEVAEFEDAFASYIGAAGCVAVANGTDALELALQALDVRPGDEVVVPAYTFVATAAAVIFAGGIPVLVDVEESTLNIDPALVEEAIGERTVGVIGVHLYGRPFDVSALAEICERRGIWYVEDAAQAHGATLAGRRVGTFGRLATWSFYPSKNLGAFGDGGALTGSDADLLDRVRRLANQGRRDHFTHGEPGHNSRLNALQAAVLNCRLPLLEADNERRGSIAQRYRQSLGEIDELDLLVDSPGDRCVYHQMTVRHPRRDALRRHLTEADVGTGIYYPRALHQQEAFADWSSRVRAPVAERAADTVLCLPIFPELSDEEVETVCAGVRAFGG